MFVARLDAQTVALNWVLQFGVRGQGVTVGGIAADDSGLYVATTVGSGTTLEDPYNGFTRKYDLNGNGAWAQQEAGTLGCEFAFFSLAYHSGSVYLTGQTTNQFLTDGVPCNPKTQFRSVVGALRKYDTNGSLNWTRRIEAGSSTGGDGFTGAKVVHASDSGIFCRRQPDALIRGARA